MDTEMNERIRELIDDAKLTAVSEMFEDDLQKFAQLIVGECLDIVANADMTELEGPDPEDVLYVACKQIREHFGVGQ